MKESIFIRNIRMLRKKANYTQEDVGRILNIQRATYSNYENGSRTPPIEIILSLAQLYGVSVDYLVGGADYSLAHPSNLLEPEEKKLLVEYTSLPEIKRREVRDFIQFKKQLPY